jgi:MAF protein
MHEISSFGMFCPAVPLVLASHSPRRKDFLWQLGIDCRVVGPPETAEPLPRAGEVPGEYAARAAKAKADAVYDVLGEENVAVLGADTVVFCGDRVLGKPADAAEALTFLHALAGKDHNVRTACYLRLGPDRGIPFHGEAVVRMGNWPEDVLRGYAESGEGLDKAGAYAVQGIGAFLVESVSGSWSAVIGLPVAETIDILLKYKIIMRRY